MNIVMHSEKVYSTFPLSRLQYYQTNQIDTEHLKIAEHLDHGNQHTFEIDDLKKLIKKTAEDLAAADAKRRDEFKVRN